MFLKTADQLQAMVKLAMRYYYWKKTCSKLSMPAVCKSLPSVRKNNVIFEAHHLQELLVSSYECLPKGNALGQIMTLAPVSQILKCSSLRTSLEWSRTSTLYKRYLNCVPNAHIQHVDLASRVWKISVIIPPSPFGRKAVSVQSCTIFKRHYSKGRDKSLPIIYLFTKEGCTLCDEAKEVLKPYMHRFTFEEVDITLPENEDWFEKYKYDIPVFHMFEDFLFMHRVDLDILEMALKRYEDARQKIKD